ARHRPAHHRAVRLGHDWHRRPRDQPHRGGARRPADGRLRRRGCRAHRGALLRLPGRARAARGCARHPCRVRTRPRGSDSSAVVRRPRGDPQGCRVLRAMPSRIAAGALVVAAMLPALDAAVQSPGAVVRLESARALPAHLAGEFEEPAGFARQPDGRYLVFDRRRHGVFAVDAARTTVTRVVEIGSETGRLLRPRAFDVHADGRFVVADAPGLRPRVSVFRPDGGLFNYFEIGGTSRPRVAIGNVVLNGIASTRLLDDTVLFSLPEHGGLVSEYSLAGTPVRSFGELRATGHEDDRDVHLALNAALPVPAPDGHVYVVFLAGAPALRKYAPDGRLVYARVVQS